MNCAVVGGQFGSEGKGLIVSEIAKDYGHHVRVGAANAGHTLYMKSKAGWDKHVMQQVPCAAYANPEAELYIGPGALISLEILHEEMLTLAAWRLERGMEAPKIYIDGRAQLIHDRHIRVEQATDLAERIGSTSTIAKEGIGAAQAARVMREPDCITAASFYGDIGYAALSDVPKRLSYHDDVLLEGTQGTGLSLTTGVHPYTTSRNTTINGLCADAGIPASLVSRRILVFRTYPIRVAGRSGPFWGDSREIDWRDIGVNPENERTTVTKKVRRVAEFSYLQLEESCMLNDPTEIALTFADYVAPEIAGATELSELTSFGAHKLTRMIEKIEDASGVKVTMLGTGPHSVIHL